MKNSIDNDFTRPDGVAVHNEVQIKEHKDNRNGEENREKDY